MTQYGLDNLWLASRWDRIFLTHTDQPWSPPIVLYEGYRISLLAVEWLGCGINYIPLSSANLKGRVELYLYSSSWLLWPLIGQPYFYLLLFVSGVQIVNGYSTDYIIKMMLQGNWGGYNQGSGGSGGGSGGGGSGGGNWGGAGGGNWGAQGYNQQGWAQQNYQQQGWKGKIGFIITILGYQTYYIVCCQHLSLLNFIKEKNTFALREWPAQDLS